MLEKDDLGRAKQRTRKQQQQKSEKKEEENDGSHDEREEDDDDEKDGPANERRIARRMKTSAKRKAKENHRVPKR